MSNPRTAVCKGAWSLNSNCGNCRRCLETAPAYIAQLRLENKALESDLQMYVNAWKRELGGCIGNKRHLIDALVLGTKQLKENFEKWRDETAAMKDREYHRAVARTLGVEEPS